MAARLKLLDSKKQIANKILTEAALIINRALNSVLPLIRADIRVLLEIHIKAQPHYESLLGAGAENSLRAHFGIPADSRETIVEGIINKVVNSVQTTGKIEVAGNKFSGGLTVKAIESSYRDLFALPEAIVVTEEPTILPWLEWLLTFGDTGIVEGYDVKGIRGRGRSGLGIMIEQQDVWGVPTKFASKGRVNWLTLAVKTLIGSGDLEQSIMRRLKDAL